MTASFSFTFPNMEHSNDRQIGQLKWIKFTLLDESTIKVQVFVESEEAGSIYWGGKTHVRSFVGQSVFSLLRDAIFTEDYLNWPIE